MGIRHKKRADATAIVTGQDWDDEHEADGLLGLFANALPTPETFPYVKADGSPGLAPISAPARGVLSQATIQLMRAALGAAALDSPAFINAPTAPTAPLGTNTDQIATMAALKASRDSIVNAAPGTLDTLNELAAAIGGDASFAATMAAALGNRLRFDAVQSLTSLAKAQAVANLGLAAVAVSGAYADLAGKPVLFSGAYADLSGKPALFSGAYADLSGKPALFSGAYADLSGKPTLGTAAALNAGVAANNVVQLTAAGKLPAIDGSALTGIVASSASGASGNFAVAGQLTVAGSTTLGAGGSGSAQGQLFLSGGTGAGGGGVAYFSRGGAAEWALGPLGLFGNGTSNDFTLQNTLLGPALTVRRADNLMSTGGSLGVAGNFAVAPGQTLGLNGIGGYTYFYTDGAYVYLVKNGVQVGQW